MARCRAAMVERDAEPWQPGLRQAASMVLRAYAVVITSTARGGMCDLGQLAR